MGVWGKGDVGCMFLKGLEYRWEGDVGFGLQGNDDAVEATGDVREAG